MKAALLVAIAYAIAGLGSAGWILAHPDEDIDTSYTEEMVPDRAWWRAAIPLASVWPLALPMWCWEQHQAAQAESEDAP